MEFSREDLEAFLSKSDFDFSTVAGWEEFIAERRAGGAGRDADGIQVRDIKNYAVGTANIYSTGSPLKAWLNVRSLGTGLALAPGLLYVYYPDASDTKQVKSFYLGPPTSSADFYLDVGGGGAADRPHWDMMLDLSRNCAAPLPAYIAQKENDNGNETHNRISPGSGARCTYERAYTKAGRVRF